MNATEPAALLPAPKPNPRPDVDGAAPAADFSKFLTLLTAQLRNQDPMQPIDSTEFVAQLASFSTVEQLVGTNERLDRLQTSAMATEVATLAGWIGRDVAATDGAFQSSGHEVEFSALPLSGTQRITARVLAKDGTDIRTFEIPANDNGGGTGKWDGRDDDGLPVIGEVSIQLSYRNGDTVLHTAPATVFREVLAVRATAEGPLLELADGSSIMPSAIGHVRGALAAGVVE